MSIDKRGHYYRSRRINGQPRKEYVASGEIGKQFAEIDEALRILEREKRQAAKGDATAMRADLDELRDRTDLVVAVLMTAAGFHRHDRGPWRRRRGKREQKDK